MESASASPKARCAVSAAVHTPTPGSVVRASLASTAGRVDSRSSASARCAQPTIVRARPGSTLARGTSQDGIRRHSWAEGGTRIREGAGPGAGVPNLVTSRRQARNASAPGTRCSITAGISASITLAVRPNRRCGTRAAAAATTGCCGSKSPATSSNPSKAGSASMYSSAPSPHAWQATVSGEVRWMRAVTGPLACKLVRQMARSAPS